MISISWTTETFAPGSVTIAEHELRFDAMAKISHQHASVLTDHAVESGQNLVDHKRPEPTRISISAEVTNTPAGPAPPSGFGRGEIVGSTRRIDTVAGGATVLAFDEPFDRVADVHETLVRLSLEAIPVTLVTGSRVYDDLQVESAEIRQDAGFGRSATLEIQLREVRIAVTRSVEAEPREPRARPPADDAQEPSSGDAATASVSRQIADGRGPVVDAARDAWRAITGG